MGRADTRPLFLPSHDDTRNRRGSPVRQHVEPDRAAHRLRAHAVRRVDERKHGGRVAASEHAYRAIAEFQLNSAYPYLLRTWNYLDAINEGGGDAERYRGFCSGRVASFNGRSPGQFPAATVIGRRDGQPVLQVYWLAARLPGLALENPRQLPAYRCPSEYGPASPAFSRAMLVAPDALIDFRYRQHCRARVCACGKRCRTTCRCSCYSATSAARICSSNSTACMPWAEPPSCEVSPTSRLAESRGFRSTPALHCSLRARRVRPGRWVDQ